jgi:hypothetical protein
MISRKVQKLCLLTLTLSLFGAASNALADTDKTLVVTSTNAAKNQLLVYSAEGKLLQTLSPQGKGGASGNAGGIEAKNGLIAVVNFGSQTVATFERDGSSFHFKQLVPTISSPVSVAFGHDHLYILGTTSVESHRMYGWDDVSSSPDGVVTLLKADGSAAQVGVLPDHLIVSEKSNVIETVALLGGGAVTGVPTLAMNIPANVNAPFGLITRGNDAYVTIAHANEISLVRNGDVLTVVGSNGQGAPCWLTLVGPFLFSSNTASKTVSRYAVYGQKIVQDAGVVASTSGATVDIDSGDGLVAVIDNGTSTSNISIFTVDEDGNLTLRKATSINSVANGVAVVPDDDDAHHHFNW